MNSIDQKWWDIIKPPSGAAPGGMPSPAAPQSALMGYMQGGGLDRWLNQPRQPGSGGTPQPAPVPTPQAPAPQAAPQSAYPPLSMDDRIGWALFSKLNPSANMSEEEYAALVQSQKPQTGFWG